MSQYPTYAQVVAGRYHQQETKEPVDPIQVSKMKEDEEDEVIFQVPTPTVQMDIQPSPLSITPKAQVVNPPEFYPSAVMAMAPQPPGPAPEYVSTKRNVQRSPFWKKKLRNGPFPYHKQKQREANKLKIVVLDLEMTGLSPEKHLLLEVAVTVCDENLTELGNYHSVRYVPADVLHQVIDTWSKNTHTSNGLLEEVQAVGKPAPVIDSELCHFLWKMGGINDDTCFVPAGISIQNDLRFLEKQLPKFFDALHYQVIELSGIGILYDRWASHKYMEKDPQPRKHRATLDVQYALDFLRWIKMQMEKPKLTKPRSPQSVLEPSNRVLYPDGTQSYVSGGTTFFVAPTTTTATPPVYSYPMYTTSATEDFYFSHPIYYG